MKFVEYKLATGAMLTGYLRDETTEMPSYNTRPAVLILPGGGYRYCSAREADPVAVQFLQAGYHVFTLIYSTDHAPLLWQPLTEAASAILYLRRNAADLRIAADKITIVGFSAGAHLAASTALLWDAAPVQQALGITGTEARPNAVVLGYPVITSGKFAHRGSFENLCGADEALLQTMSLETCRLSCTCSPMAAMAPAPAPTRSTPLTSITTPGCPCAWAGWGRPWILPCDLSSPMKKLFL